MTNTKKTAPIGVFDSGVGGLTVAREIMRNLPKEDIVYFGDTARVPYGSKSKDNINIENMSKYLRKNNIEFYLRDINIEDKYLVNELNEYERIMDNDNEIVFLEVNKLIIEKYKERL